MTGEDYRLWASLPPEALQQMMGLGTIDDQSALLAQQSALAEALGRQQPLNRSTVGGQIGQGLGNIIGAIGGGIKQNQLMGQQRGLIDQRQQGRNAYANALADALRTRFAPAAKSTEWGGMVPAGMAPAALTEAELSALEAPPKKKQPMVSANGLPPPSFFGM